MIKKQKLLKTPLGKALKELSEELNNKNMPPVTLNVIGGFALLLREKRDPESITDIDYVGPELSQEIKDLATPIGIKYGLGYDWINNDVMLCDISMEDFEFSTGGSLNFEKAFSVGKIKINVLDEIGLLRMKLIAIDTSLCAASNEGEFTREKDLPDIVLLMNELNMTTKDLQNEFGDLIIEKSTFPMIRLYQAKGSSVVDDQIEIIANNQSMEK